jgi:hypothetical protein
MRRLNPMTIVQLQELIKHKQVICFGLGNQGRRAALYFHIWGLDDNLVAFADNDESKTGKNFICFNRKIPVISPDEILQQNNENLLILITSIYYNQIYEELDQKLAATDIPVASLDETSDVEIEYSTYKGVVKESTDPVIPKIIHYSWFGGNKTESIFRNIENWKTLCPDYEFIEWNESNYDVTKNKYMYQAYQKKIWGFVPDYLRLDVLYKYGGLYLDTDIELLKRPDSLLYQNCFGCIDGSLTMNLGSGFGCRPGVPIIKELRDYYDNCEFVRSDGSVDKTSCSTHSLNVLMKYGVQIDNKLQNVNGMNIYPMIIQGKNQYSGKVKVTDKTFWIHHGNMSWF